MILSYLVSSLFLEMTLQQIQYFELSLLVGMETSSPSFSLRFNTFGGNASLTISCFSSFFFRCARTRSVDLVAEVEVVDKEG